MTGEELKRQYRAGRELYEAHISLMDEKPLIDRNISMEQIQEGVDQIFQKPPLGLEPAVVVYDVRINAICNAILRALAYPSANRTEEYKKIEKWSYELNAIARLMYELEKKI